MRASAHGGRAEVLALDRRHAWHPYASHDDWESDPDALVLTAASGTRFRDADGRWLLDGNASWWTAVLGHRHPRLVAALERQLATMPHVPFAGITHEPAARLASELVAVAPAGLTRVFYSDDGSTALEVAVKMAVQCHAQRGEPRRRRFVALEGAFHGDTVGAASLGGVEVFRRPYASVLFDCLQVPLGAGGHDRSFDALGKLMDQVGHEVAAVVLEPVLQGAAGMRQYEPALVHRARELTRRAGALLVLDEVFTGFGRTGTFWAAEQAGVTPDLLCTAKALGGGMLPFAATLATEDVFRAFRGGRDRAFFHGHTFCGNPLGAAVAREVLAVFREERVLEGVPRRTAMIEGALLPLGELPGVREVRCVGMVGAVELEGQGYLDSIGWRVYREALARGAYLRPLGNVVYLAPRIDVPEEDLAELLDVLVTSVRAVLTP